MAIIVPFKALRPQAQFAKQVASRPYDVLNRAEAKLDARGNPASFLHITKAEIDLPETVDIHAQEVYLKARENLKAFIQRELLFQESKPCYYIYQLIMNGRTQTGLVCGSSVDDYDNNVILKHEFTRPDKELDRINHMQITGAQTGNVFLAYRPVADIDAIISHWKKSKSPVYEFIADDGVQHSVWVVSDEKTIASITKIFSEQVPQTYIADGHHRAASAAKVRQALGAKATVESNYFLTTLFPSDQLHILDYNRVVKDLNGHAYAKLFELIAHKFDIESKGKEPYRPAQMHEIGMYADSQWYKLTAREGTYRQDPIGVLDVTILQENLLTPVLGIGDPRTDERIDFVGGIRGLEGLQERVDKGEAAIAFSLYPVSMDQLFAIADSGNVMPPKSTWFEPKLRDGLLTHLIAD